MQRAGPSDEELIAAPALAPEDPQAEAVIAGHQRRNFLALTVYQVVLRSGWIFKTESIIMPAVLDLISDQPWVRAMLPLLNRLGQSIPPLLMSRRSQQAPYKSRMLLSTTLAMAVCFGSLSLLWLLTEDQPTWWLKYAFLACYGVFFAAMGVNSLVFSMTQGKLIEVTRRGRLLSVSNTLGAAIAIGCAILLLPQWLDEGQADVAEIFGFAAGCFFLSAVALLFLVEPADRLVLPPQSMLAQLKHVLAPLGYDRNFRRLMYVAAMYGTSMSLFPHYQYVGLSVVKLDLTELLWWLILQNIGMAAFSFVAGPVADRFGNRLVLQLSMLGLCSAPLATVLLGAYGTEAGRWFNVVFVLVGLTPVTYRTVQNYTLEICKPEDQSRYLSAVGLGMASTLILSPLLGWVMGVFDYEIVFYIVTLMIASGWLVTLGLQEPRLLNPSSSLSPPLSE